MLKYRTEGYRDIETGKVPLRNIFSRECSPATCIKKVNSETKILYELKGIYK